MASEWAGLVDFFTNERKADRGRLHAEESKPSISMVDLVNKKVSTVRCQGKLYEITVREIEVL